MEMVTRYAGEAHITAEGWGDLNRGIVGTESYALPMGREFEADLVSNNLLKIYDGCGVMQGREVRIPAGQSEEVTIENGTQGEKRIDLVVERYSKNEDTKIESSETILIKGTPSETDPQVPDHIEGDIRAGDMTADWPLYEVELDGINVVAVRPVFGILMNMAVLKEMVSDLSSKMTDIILRKSKTNRINVAAGQRSVSGIILDAIEGYTPLVSLVWSSHSTTITSDCHIDNDRVTFYFDAKSAQTPETFTAETIYVKNTVISNSP